MNGKCSLATVIRGKENSEVAESAELRNTADARGLPPLYWPRHRDGSLHQPPSDVPWHRHSGIVTVMADEQRVFEHDGSDREEKANIAFKLTVKVKIMEISVELSPRAMIRTPRSPRRATPL